MSTFCYDETVRCTSGPQPGAIALRDFGVDHVTLDLLDWGIFNCRDTVGGTTLSEHGEGRAWDAGTVIVTEDGDLWFDFLWQNAAELGVELVIYDREVWSGLNPTVHAYAGLNPHTDHVHSGLCWVAARSLTVAKLQEVWGRWIGDDDELSEDEVKRIMEALKGIRNAIRRVRQTQLAQGEIQRATLRIVRDLAQGQAVASEALADIDAAIADLDDDLEQLKVDVQGDPAEVLGDDDPDQPGGGGA